MSPPTSKTQQDLEAALAQGVKDQKIPQAIIYATNSTGSFSYSFSTGAPKDAILMLASQTKLLTSIAALQAVEQGHLSLDQDVTPHIPEISKYGIITGFDANDQPTFVDRAKPITLRHLLTHSSGADYGWNPDVVKHVKYRGGSPAKQANAPTILERYDYPLLFEPGEGWNYSPGLDWIGLLLLRLTGEDLETRFKKYILSPLNLSNITFWATKTPSLAARIPQLVTRTSSGGLELYNETTLNTLSTDCFGGHGAYAQLSDYLAVMRSLLANDGKLLSPSMVKDLFSPQLGPASEEALNNWVQNFGSMLPGTFDPSIKMQYGLGGALQMSDWPEVGRKKGTLLWSGYFNPVWYIDRESDLAWTFGTNMVPPGDEGCKEMTGLAEKAVYKMLEEWKQEQQQQK